jgi:hypothetical protein
MGVECELQELFAQLLGELPSVLPTLTTTALFDAHLESLVSRAGCALERCAAVLEEVKEEAPAPQTLQEKAALKVQNAKPKKK